LRECAGGARERSYRIVKLLLKQQEVFLRTFQEKVFGLGAAGLGYLTGLAVQHFLPGATIPA
jgi:hypothetical protein